MKKSLDRILLMAILEACYQEIDSQPTEAKPSPDPLCHYVIVREDIPRGLQAAQIVHAAGESSPGNLSPGTYAIVLSVPSEVSLRGLSQTLERAGVKHRLIVENSHDYEGQAMAIGVVPQKRSRLRRHFSSLPLLK